MPSNLIVSTNRGDFNAMRYQGILVTDSHAQLAAMLESSLSREHALFLAEPMHDAAGSTTDWYTEAEGAPLLLSDLSPDDQNKAREKISQLASDIGRLAEELKNSDNPSKNIRGNILALALRYPGLEHVYMVGTQPVLACWGFGPGTLGAQPEDLQRMGMIAPPPAPPSPPLPPPASPPLAPVPVSEPVAAAFPWWRALLAFLAGLLLLLALFFLAGLLFGPSGCLPRGMLSTFFLPGCARESAREAEKEREDGAPAAAMTVEQEKERLLRRQIEDLRRLLEAKAAQCAPPARTPEPSGEAPRNAPEPVEPAPVESPKEQEEAPSLADFMPTTPDPPPPPPEAPKLQAKPEEPKAKPQPKPKPETPKQARGEDMRIPENARKNKDVSFLEGCWDSTSTLRSSNTGEAVQVQYCFNANGGGTRTIVMPKSGDRCTGSVRARFDPLGNLRMDADSAPCRKRGGFVPQQVQCVPGADGKAQCNGRELGDSPNKRWGASFKRK